MEAFALTGTGSGSLLLTPAGPLSSLGLPLLGAQPASIGAIDIPIPGPKTARNIVGLPKLALTYAGSALPARSWVYAQIVDNKTGRVVGSQVTPVPLTLDGKSHQVNVDLNAIATRARVGSSCKLQLIPGSLIYGLQHSPGTVHISRAVVRLPLH